MKSIVHGYPHPKWRDSAAGALAFLATLALVVSWPTDGLKRALSVVMGHEPTFALRQLLSETGQLYFTRFTAGGAHWSSSTFCSGV